MKMTKAHFKQLKGLVEPLNTDEIRTKYLSKDFPRASQVKDLNKRFRWDLLWAVPNTPRNTLISALYLYLNDTHIDTALRYIVKELQHD